MNYWMSSRAPFMILLILIVVVVVVAKERPCDYICLAGRCEYRDCFEAVCPGGACTYYDCTRPSCKGGSCIFFGCWDPTCEGGSCIFNNSRTTLRDGYCNGGGCWVQGRRWPSKFQNSLSS